MKIAFALGQRSGRAVTDDAEGLSVWFVFISWLLFKFNSITPNILLLFSLVFLGYFTMESILCGAGVYYARLRLCFPCGLTD